MKKIYVLQVPWIKGDVLEELRRLLKALGFDLVLLAPEDADCVQADDQVLIVVSTELDEHAETCAGIERVLSRGAQAVGVWPPGQSQGTVPSIIIRGGSGVTTCDQRGMQELVVAAAAGGETWLEPAGRPMPKRPLKRGGC